MAPILIAVWQWRKAILYTALVAAVALMGWRVSVWHNAYERLGDVEAALETERLCEEGSACAARQAALEAAQAETTAKVVATYEQELASVRNRPARVVRLCPNPGDVQGSRPAGTADGTGPGAGQLSGSAGRDIGPDLYQLAREADEVAARLRALQEWNAALAR
jgi:hypothetical protein